MDKSSSHIITNLLVKWRNGDQMAFKELMPLVYEELHRIAQLHFAKCSRGEMVQATMLVHEAYIRLVNENEVQWKDRAHFYAVASNIIRWILVDHYRKRTANKRGGKENFFVSLTNIEELSTPQSIDFIALHEALDKLASLNTRQAKIVEMRFFGGMTNDDIAAALDLSRATIEKEWASAKAWLYLQLTSS
jgi:RNA polymerase sigma factor (TIGR02999 family)